MQWKKWLYGLAATIIGGGAAAVSAGLASALIDPQKLNVHSGLHSLLEIMAVTFFIAALTHAMAYLSQSPLPTAPSSWDSTDRRGSALPTKVP